MIGRLARTVVPDILYLEYKALYLELKPSVARKKSGAAKMAALHTAATGETPVSRGARSQQVATLPLRPSHDGSPYRWVALVATVHP